MENKTKFKEAEIGRISEEWSEISLGSVVTFQRGYDLPLKFKKNGPYPIIMSNGIGGYHNEFKAKGPGVTIGRSGNLGEPFYTGKDYWPHNTTLYIKKYHNAYPKFVYYFLKGLKLSRFNAGSAVPTLNRNHIHPIPIIFPNKVAEQKDIAKILSDLDSKIELNQQMNKTLETIGQALFKRWFVDFEFPNEERNPYKSSGGEMIDSELGEIPKGWKITELKECGDVICGKTPSTKDKNNYGVDVPFITIADMRGQVFVIKTERKLSLDGAKTQVKKKLPPLSICVSCIATPGLVALTSETSHTNQQINSIICKKGISPYFIYLTMSRMSEQIKLLGLGGTATLNLNTGNFSKIKIIYPSMQVMKNFHGKTKAIFDKILLTVKEINMLCRIRDSLLPRLMSGKIRVSYKRC